MIKENCYLKISYSTNECFVYQFDRITVTLNYKEDEVNVLEEKARFGKCFKQFNVNKSNQKYCSNYKIYNSTGRQQQKPDKNTEFVIDRQKGPEPCAKRIDQKSCRYCENDNYKHFDESLDLVQEGDKHSVGTIIEEGEIIEIID